MLRVIGAPSQNLRTFMWPYRSYCDNAQDTTTIRRRDTTSIRHNVFLVRTRYDTNVGEVPLKPPSSILTWSGNLSRLAKEPFITLPPVKNICDAAAYIRMNEILLVRDAQ